MTALQPERRSNLAGQTHDTGAKPMLLFDDLEAPRGQQPAAVTKIDEPLTRQTNGVHLIGEALVGLYFLDV